MDIAVIFYLLSLLASEVLRENSPKDGTIYFAGYLIATLLPYIVGRFLIEPDLRFATCKRIVLLFLFLTPTILYEYKMGQNPWLIYGPMFGVYSGSFVQLRGGHTRIQVCFGHAIITGILLLIVILFNCWLIDIYKRDKTRLGPLLSKLGRYRLPAILLILFLYLTGSKGPMISTAVGYMILQISRFRNPKVGAVVIFSILAIGGAAVYTYLDKYTSATDTSNMGEEQASAIYRREMLTNYAPYIEEGGWLGWGALSRPVVNGQFSIDNHYLLTQLTQGKLGLYLFLSMAVYSCLSTARRALSFASHEDRLFAWTLLGCLLGLFVSLTAVWLGQQSAPVCFLLLGWSQSLQDTESIEENKGLALQAKYRFTRVFV